LITYRVFWGFCCRCCCCCCFKSERKRSHFALFCEF